MADTSPSLDLLCELSARERQLAENPDAHGYLKLASGYAEAGWIKEATRAAQRAKALAQGTEGERTDGAVLSGPCTPKVLLEIVRAMTLTGKSGHLQLDAPGGIRVSLALADGQLVGAQSSDKAKARSRPFVAVFASASLCTRRASKPTPSSAMTTSTSRPSKRALHSMCAA